MNKKLNLNRNKRFESVNVTLDKGKLTLSSSRDDCRDVLVEMVDSLGGSQSKPLSKVIDTKISFSNLAELRFIMNDQSVRPIDIQIFIK